MLVSLILHTALAAAAPAAPPTEGAPRHCADLLVQAMEPKMSSEALAGYADRLAKDGRRKSMGLVAKPWTPRENPEAGFYAAVVRHVDGCPVPTPIFLPNAQEAPRVEFKPADAPPNRR